MRGRRPPRPRRRLPSQATTDLPPGRRSGLIGRPVARAGIGYRLVRRLCHVAWRLFRIRVTGLENLPRDASGAPAGGWICAGLPHRTWVEPTILVGMLPAEPRLVMMADAHTALGSRWRRLLVGRVGGVVLIPRRPRAGVTAFAEQSAAVGKVLAAGAVFSIFPEQGPPARPPALRRVSPALAYFALRTGRPIVPIVFGGTDALFLRRPIEVRVLPALHPPATAPEPGSPAERTAAAQLLGRLLAAVEHAAAEAHAAAEPPVGTRRRWRWLTGPYPRAD